MAKFKVYPVLGGQWALAKESPIGLGFCELELYGTEAEAITEAKHLQSSETIIG